jgi:CheY-like chemotaxis protein
MLISAFISDLGINHSEAASGCEALDLIRNGKFNLVLVDIQMPDSSGSDIANILNNELVHMPVMIAVTAHAFKKQREAIMDTDFYACIPKPEILDNLTRLSPRFTNHERWKVIHLKSWCIMGLFGALPVGYCILQANNY